jgi:hypothetical protein
MAKIKIDSLEKLERFISNEKVSKESRFKVFKLALKDYVFYVELDKGEHVGFFDPESKIIADMKQQIEKIKATPQSSHYRGLMVIYNNN